MRQQRKQQERPKVKESQHRNVLARVFLTGCAVLGVGSYYIRYYLVDTVSEQDIARQREQYDRLARQEGRLIMAYKDER